MRRLWMACLLAVLVLAGGCTSGGGSSGGGSSSGGSSPGGASPASSASAGSNTAQVCADAKRVVKDGTEKFATTLPQAVQAVATGNKDAQNRALQAIRTSFTDWAAGLRTQAGRALDSDLRSALTDYASALDALVAQLNTVDDLSKVAGLNTPELQAAQDKLSKLCGD
jgi:hypothetical protein